MLDALQEFGVETQQAWLVGVALQDHPVGRATHCRGGQVCVFTRSSGPQSIHIANVKVTNATCSPLTGSMLDRANAWHMPSADTWTTQLSGQVALIKRRQT